MFKSMSQIQSPRTTSLLVDKRRGKVKDQSGQGDNSENREQVSTEVTDVGGDHVGRSGNVASREVSHVVDHVDLGCFPGDEGRADYKTKTTRWLVVMDG